MQYRTRRLWGRDIDIVEGGLDEDQVVDFVSQLMIRYRALVERQEHYLSLGTLSEKAAIEADKLAADIKARSREEAGAEATKTVARARQRAQEMIASARKSAQEVTRTETVNLLEAAHRKASVIDTEARQRAQLLLIKARAAIESDLKAQFSDVYSQLLSSLRDLLGEGHDIEAGWKGKLVELWKREPLELGAYDAVPSVLAAEITRMSGMAGTGSGAKVEISPAELAATEEEVFFEASSRETQAGEVSPAAAAGRRAGALTPEDFGVAAEQRAVSEERPPEGVGPAGEERPREGLAHEPFQEGPKVAHVPDETKVEAKLPPGYEGELEGEVDISLQAPVELSVMSRIYAELQGNPEMKVLRTVGSYDKGTTITILLEKPIRLVEMLTRIPGVGIGSGPAGRQGFLKRAIGGQERDLERITIPLKTQH